MRTFDKQIKPKPKNLVSDLVAGVTNAVVNIPDSIAAAVLAGVNPTYAFNAIMVGTPVGAFFTSSEFMQIAPTSALMLVVGSSLADISEDMILPAIVTLAVMVGIFQLTMGLLKLGSITRFISNAVMTGFLTGLAVLIILGQLGDLTGFDSQAGKTLGKTFDLLLHPTGIDPTSTAIGLITLLVIVLLNHTRLRNFSLVLALFIASALVIILGWSSVEVVGDIAQISGGLPSLALPDISLVPKLIVPALSVGIIGLIQGAGVSQGVPNSDGTYPDASGDFAGQGIANTVTGFFSGLPVGGSLGGTSVNLSSGAKSRWSNIFTGIFFAIIILLFGNLVELAAMPAVAAILVYAGYGIIDAEDIMQVHDTHWGPRLVMIVTFLSTLILPIQYAILLGVVLSILLYVITSAAEVRITELVFTEEGYFEEHPAPEELPSGKVTLLVFRGSLYFAGAYAVEDKLPSALTAKQAVVILRLRGRVKIGSTFIEVLERYSTALGKNGGKLMLSGVDEKIYDQLEKTEMVELLGEENIFLDSSKLLYSSKQALKAANTWLGKAGDVD
ncbi:SulP family inorganic anion transporter [Chloroflexota bacterium]